MQCDEIGNEREGGGERVALRTGEYTPWITLKFRGTLGTGTTGSVRFLLRQREPEVAVYATPVQIDPQRPALPISHPAVYSSYVAKRLGT